MLVARISNWLLAESLANEDYLGGTHACGSISSNACCGCRHWRRLLARPILGDKKRRSRRRSVHIKFTRTEQSSSQWRRTVTLGCVLKADRSTTSDLFVLFLDQNNLVQAMFWSTQLSSDCRLTKIKLSTWRRSYIHLYAHSDVS